jgi:pre-mRNA-processing factor SLU7
MSNNIDNKEDDEYTPHMPQYIVKPPWYLNQTENSLEHQKVQSNTRKLPITIFTEKGISQGAVYKFRKGACENCGSMTHKLKECCERPRRVGAKHSGKDFKPDEYIYEVPLDYEGKRDRWNGYDPDTYKKLVYEYERFNEMRKQYKEDQAKDLKDERLKKKLLKDDDLDENISSEDENRFLNKYEAEEYTDDQINEYIEALKKDPRNKNVDFEKISKEELYQFATSKSLNIDADYSKYLISLSLNSAYYDPKSRSMRENPMPDVDGLFKGDNHNRITGDTKKLVEVESFINKANMMNRELNLNLVAGPTQAELYHRYHTDEKDKFTSKMKSKLIEKYGGEQHLKIPENIITPVSEDYVEYTPKGEEAIIKTSLERKSKYAEDIFVNGHTTIWGSYFHENFGWGYKCCLSFDKNSVHSIEAKKDNLKMLDDYERKKHAEREKARLLAEKKNEEMYKKDEKERKEGIFSEMFDRMNTYESGGINAVKEKLTKKKRERDLEESAKNEVERNKRDMKNFDRNGIPLSKEDTKVTPEDMEAYKLMKVHFDDPIKNMK